MRSATLSALAVVALGCSGDFELASLDASLEPARDDAPFRFDPRDYAAKDGPSPSRAAAWSWPAPEAFRARFEERATNARSFGVAVGRRILVGDEFVEIHERPRLVLSVVAGTDGSPAWVMVDGPAPIRRGGDVFPRFVEVLAGDPLQPGRVRLGPPQYATYVDVEYASPPRRLRDEDVRDWVYARTLVESGLELTDANAESTRELVTDDGDWSAAETREAELTVACYESGLVGCYLAGRLGLVLRGQSGSTARPLPLPTVEPEILARGPVDLTRFFIGYLLDEMVISAPAMPRWSSAPSMPRWVAHAAFESGQAGAIRTELFRRARDPERDAWTRMRMLSMLTALLEVDRKPRGKWPRDPYDFIEGASAECALAVLAEPQWTMEDAHERCVEHPRRLAEALQFEYLSPMILRAKRELLVEPP